MRTHTIQDASGVIVRHAVDGVVDIVARTAPTNGQPGYATGCLWRNLAGTVGGILYLNTGTKTSTTWLNIA